MIFQGFRKGPGHAACVKREVHSECGLSRLCQIIQSLEYQTFTIESYHLAIEYPAHDNGYALPQFTIVVRERFRHCPSSAEWWTVAGCRCGTNKILQILSCTYLCNLLIIISLATLLWKFSAVQFTNHAERISYFRVCSAYMRLLYTFISLCCIGARDAWQWSTRYHMVHHTTCTSVPWVVNPSKPAYDVLVFIKQLQLRERIPGLVISDLTHFTLRQLRKKPWK